MGFGIRPGEYYGAITPADIAPTLASLCGITLAPRDGRVLGEALAKSGEPQRKKQAYGQFRSEAVAHHFFHRACSRSGNFGRVRRGFMLFFGAK